jgi:hypothetical protein
MRILLFYLLAGAAFFMGRFAVRWLLRATPHAVATVFKRVLLGVIVTLLLILFLGGGGIGPLMAFLGAATALLIRLLQYLPLLHRLWRQFMGQGAVGQRSTVGTHFLRMWLDQDTGEMGGEVLAGAFAGRDLAGLAAAELLSFYRECQADPDSAALLAAYLDRRLGPEWRSGVGAEPGPGPGASAGGEARRGREAFTCEEAYAILGLAPGAPREEIEAAHRRLIQRLHPDRGGSNYLATQINRARDHLLAHCLS